ncbi:hypothetical protein BASA81_005938 [Batrachochytrium salamandrivorans]|nr:hypothetical protein BASA81_005938 [Batrachochytrium salamandrivorans]
MEEEAKQLEEEHEAVVRSETFFNRQQRMLPFSPFQLTLATQNGSHQISAWVAFSLSLALNLLDLYLYKRYGNPTGYFPSIMNSASLLAYIVILIVMYRMDDRFDSRFVGPIVASFLTCSIMLSMVVGHPYTLESTRRLVEEPTRSHSPQFLRFNQYLTAYVLFWFVVMLVLTWCATLFDKQSPEQIVVGIVLPILIPFVIQFTSPPVAKHLYALRHRHPRKVTAAAAAGLGEEEEEKQSLLRSPDPGEDKKDEEQQPIKLE